MKRSGFSIIEALVAIAILGLLTAVVLPMLARAHEADSRNTCLGNLKQMGIVLAMYAEENGGRYPRLHGDQPFGSSSAATGCDPASLQDKPAFAPVMTVLYPEYFSDPGILLCPSDDYDRDNPLLMVEDDGSGDCGHTGVITRGNESYTYFGYLLDQGDEGSPQLPHMDMAPGQLVGLVKAFREVLGNRDPSDDSLLDQDLDLHLLGLDGRGIGNRGQDKILRLRNGMEVLYPSSNSDFVPGFLTSFMPVMWDTVHLDSTSSGMNAHHQGMGCNVLYLDGHVDFTRFARQFPGTARFAQLSGLM